jgi:hypothetical protein
VAVSHGHCSRLEGLDVGLAESGLQQIIFGQSFLNSEIVCGCIALKERTVRE